MAGREMLDIFPMVPLGRNLAPGVAIVSYNGTLNFGLVGDFKVMHDLVGLALYQARISGSRMPSSAMMCP